MSRDADSRTLANDLFRYVEEIKPHYIWIENVSEFLIWGPLEIKVLPHNKKKDIHYPHCPLQVIKDKKNKKKIVGYAPVWIPIKDRLAEYYNEWMKRMLSYGYNFEHRILNSADFGEHTSRSRYYGQFALDGLPISWPEPTHTKEPEKGLFSQNLPKWKPVKECLDFSNEGESIFSRKKPLSDKTLKRIYAGLVKYIAGGKNAFLKQYNSGSDWQRCNDLEDPCKVVTTENRFALVKADFMVQRNAGDENRVCDLNKPARVLTSTGGNLQLVQAFLTKYHKCGTNIIGPDETCSTLTTKDRLNIIQPQYLVNYNHSSDCNSVENPSPTVTTKDRLGLVKVHYWLDKQYSGTSNHQSIEQPSGSILGNDKHCLMKTEHFLDKQYSEGSRDQSIEDPAGTLTTVPKFNLATIKKHFIDNPSYQGNQGDVKAPLCTIVARQDKVPLRLVTVDEYGPVAVAIYEDDTPDMIKIKEFMALYGIVDIKMRMLEVPELLKIQGFDDGYKLIGNKTEQKKFIGNSVTPKVVKYLIESIHFSLREHLQKMAA